MKGLKVKLNPKGDHDLLERHMTFEVISEPVLAHKGVLKVVVKSSKDAKLRVYRVSDLLLVYGSKS